MWTHSDDLRRCALTVQCEQPNSAIHHFRGTLFAAGREIGVDASSLLLRGSSLRNTKFAIGECNFCLQVGFLLPSSTPPHLQASWCTRGGSPSW